MSESVSQMLESVRRGHLRKPAELHEFVVMHVRPFFKSSDLDTNRRDKIG